MGNILELNKVYNEDCISDNGMCLIEDKSIDLILTDLPYGTTRCKWDTIIPFDELWEQYNRIIKDNGAIVLTASQPFTSALVMSNPKMFKYDWMWDKGVPSGHLNAKRMPLRYHESILVFYKKQCTYNRQFTEKPKHLLRPNKYIMAEARNTISNEKLYGESKGLYALDNDDSVINPKSILQFDNPKGLKKKDNIHPTQKPVALFEYLIKTYTNEVDLVLDNCMGSFTTAIACINTNRNYIGFENDEKYFALGQERVRLHNEQLIVNK